MQNGRFRNLATLAGASLCLLATSAIAQAPSRTDSLGTPGMAAPVDTAMVAPAPMMTDTAAVVVEEEHRGFPWGLLGLLGLLGLMKKPDRDTTVVRNETYVPPDPRPRNMGTGSTTDDRTMNLGNRPPNDPTSRS